MRQRVQSGLNSCLGACAAHLSVAASVSATTAAYASPPSVSTNCRLFLAAVSFTEPLATGPSLNRYLGTGWRLSGSDGPSELESSSAFLLLMENCGDSREVRAWLPTPLWRSRAEALISLALEATSTPLASVHCIPQLLKKNWGKLKAGHIFDEGYFLLPQHCVYRRVRLPVILLPLIRRWVRGSTTVKGALLPLSAQYTTPFTDPNNNFLQSQSTKDS